MSADLTHTGALAHNRSYLSRRPKHGKHDHHKTDGTTVGQSAYQQQVQDVFGLQLPRPSPLEHLLLARYM